MFQVFVLGLFSLTVFSVTWIKMAIVLLISFVDETVLRQLIHCNSIRIRKNHDCLEHVAKLNKMKFNSDEWEDLTLGSRNKVGG